MASARKFGTFGGVFTPSLLTILGVIMYLRLPWIIGQGGLFYTIAIIVVAHIVSITTGLSVSSIATDKKVAAGGNYYIISRSMGLSIGGTLGIALFVGLSFSISLYVIGFSESLLAVLGIPVDINTIRIYGSITLLIITIVVFISTSLAIKAQYLILGAVLLSLLSIFLGGSELASVDYSLQPSGEGVDLFVLFGIFFPAVTGFTAGVQMSGDLKDPKKSIPTGTMAAIAVGFVVYIVLAVYIAFSIDSGLLRNNPNVLVEIGWIPQLVIAGIWGATISSAMGSILGAPRILQATSYDRVTPRFFSTGQGPANEPRRALILTFAIAEAGILIGELNVIARIVSMFFLSTYGLINLSYALESWASTDFRPSFKVPIWVGILGAATSAIIMFELDVVAFFGATVVLGLLFLYLKKKELSLETGDTWGSFWSSVVRSGLHRLNEAVIHKRNWRPNILLFRGSTDTRPHLLELGQWLSGKTGIITDFELVETPKGKIQFKKADQYVKTSINGTDGVFKRRHECTDIYTGIETVSQFYGFSGVEPNTVIFGWPRHTEHPEKVLILLKKLVSLDYNILLLDHNQDKAFGDFKTVDLWWRGGSNNAALALTLMRFLESSKKWERAKLRILIIVEDSALLNKVHSNMTRLLHELRQDAEVKVINNAIEKRAFQDIMKIESANSDLSIIGLPFLENVESRQFIENTNAFIRDLNAVLFINASSFFEPYYIGIERKIDQEIKSEQIQNVKDLTKIKLPENDQVARKLQETHELILQSIQEFYDGYMLEVAAELRQIGQSLNGIIQAQFQSLAKRTKSSENTHTLTKALTRIQSDLLYNSLRLLNAFRENDLNNLERNLEQGLENVFKNHQQIIENTPASYSIYFKPHQISISMDDTTVIKSVKARKLFKHRFLKKEIKIDVRLQAFINYHLRGYLRLQLLEQLQTIGISGYHAISALQNIFNRIPDFIKAFITSVQENGELSPAEIENTEHTINDLFKEYQDTLDDKMAAAFKNVSNAHIRHFEENIRAFDQVDINRIIKKEYTIKKPSVSQELFKTVPAQITRNMSWLIDFAGMELLINIFKARLNVLLKKWLEDVDVELKTKISPVTSKIEKLVSKPETLSNNDTLQIVSTDDQKPQFIASIENIAFDLRKSIEELPEIIEVISEQSFRSLEQNQFEEQEIVSVYLRRLIGYLIETEFINDLMTAVTSFNLKTQEAISSLKESSNLLVSEVMGNEDESAESKTDLPTLFEKINARVIAEQTAIEKAYADLKNFSDERLQTAFGKMNPYLITHTTNNLRQYIFAHEQRLVLSRIEEQKKKISDFLQKIFVKIQYSQSEGVLFARKLNRIENDQNIGTIDRLISITRMVAPNPEVISRVPRYYQQLFVGEHSISRQFLVSRRDAILQAERIIKRYNEGYKGALLIQGDPRSGKSALSRMIASRHFDRQHVFRLNAPTGGSIDYEIFKRKLQEVTHLEGSPEEIFTSLPPKSAIVLNDLELWWERSHDGMQIINHILNLIDTYGHKILFIININPYAFQLINHLKNVENSFVGIINSEAFSAKELETAILRRHRSTGLKFEMNGQPENRISDMRMASMFNSIFRYSGGAVGVALQSWLSMIYEIRDEQIIIKKAHRPELKLIADLDSNWHSWLIQFVLHKQLTRERLQRIFSISIEEANQMVEILMRSGFVVAGLNNTLIINPYLEHMFIGKFKQMGLLWKS